MSRPIRVLIMGAAGRDFFDFLSFFKDRSDYRVKAFTATQIPGISHRRFPKEMAGKLYRKDIPIFSESQLPHLIKKLEIDEVYFSYSDVTQGYIMDRASLVASCGARFCLLPPDMTMLKSKKPIISICAVRTGAGKSPTTRMVSNVLRDMGLRVVVVRHPMPYGNLIKQAIQRYENIDDLDKNKCTIEEREEYESHINNGIIVYAGVDYEGILKQAEKEADIIIWDGGNNDPPFYKPDLHIVIADARRSGHELTYYHGSVNVRMADIVMINKVRTTDSKNVRQIERNVKSINPKAVILKSDMTKKVDNSNLIRNKKVLVVEDGPTLTHGGLSIGAGYLAARMFGAKEIIDPRPYAVGSIKKTFSKFPHLEKVLPAMGYSKFQMEELERTINRTPADSVVIGTPVDLAKHLKIKKPSTRVTYDIKVLTRPGLDYHIRKFSNRIKRAH